MQRMPGKYPAGRGGDRDRPRIAGVRLQVATRIELRHGAGRTAQQAMRIGRMFAGARMLVDLHPFDAGSGADFNPAPGAVRQCTGHRRQQRLQHQRKQQDAGKQSSMAGGSEHGGRSVSRSNIGPLRPPPASRCALSRKLRQTRARA